MTDILDNRILQVAALFNLPYDRVSFTVLNLIKNYEGEAGIGRGPTKKTSIKDIGSGMGLDKEDADRAYNILEDILYDTEWYTDITTVEE
jgi:hypothetical protein